MEEKWKQNTKYNELKKRSKIAKKKKLKRERKTMVRITVQLSLENQ
jgi:hypothetical protein